MAHNRSLFRKSYMFFCTLPINSLATVFALFIVVAIRAYNKAKYIHLKLESLEKGN
jgi:hypothetical protein